VCKLIIGGGSCNNVTSAILIDKLQLPTKLYLTPYSLQWLKKESEITTSKQALIAFSASPYCGEVLRDVLSMGTCHLLLGRPWLFDNHAIHDG